MTTIVIFGITGDLAKKKLFPAILKLRRNIKIVGFSRRPFKAPKVVHVQGNYNDSRAFQKLKNYITENNLFYLAVPPSTYPAILKNLYKSGLHKNVKVLIEKPFGNSLKTAKSLNLLLKKCFKEKQIYRVDHYLGKKSVVKIAKAKFNSKKIKKIEINLFQKEGVGKRGVFYDKIGALKDVGQNHLLALLCLIIGPKIQKLRLKGAVRGQYKRYRKEKSVKINSKTETYFKIIAQLGPTEIVLSSGKKMRKNRNEVKIYFKNGKQKIFKIGSGGYERVIRGAMAGNHAMFPSMAEVIAQWKFTEKVGKELKKTSLTIY